MRDESTTELFRESTSESIQNPKSILKLSPEFADNCETEKKFGTLKKLKKQKTTILLPGETKETKEEYVNRTINSIKQYLAVKRIKSYIKTYQTGVICSNCGPITPELVDLLEQYRVAERPHYDNCPRCRVIF